MPPYRGGPPKGLKGGLGSDEFNIKVAELFANAAEFAQKVPERAIEFATKEFNDALGALGDAFVPASCLVGISAEDKTKRVVLTLMLSMLSIGIGVYMTPRDVMDTLVKNGLVQAASKADAEAIRLALPAPDKRAPPPEFNFTDASGGPPRPPPGGFATASGRELVVRPEVPAAGAWWLDPTGQPPRGGPRGAALFDPVPVTGPTNEALIQSLLRPSVDVKIIKQGLVAVRPAGADFVAEVPVPTVAPDAFPFQQRPGLESYRSSIKAPRLAEAEPGFASPARAAPARASPARLAPIVASPGFAPSGASRYRGSPARSFSRKPEGSQMGAMPAGFGNAGAAEVFDWKTYFATKAAPVAAAFLTWKGSSGLPGIARAAGPLAGGSIADTLRSTIADFNVRAQIVELVSSVVGPTIMRLVTAMLERIIGVRDWAAKGASILTPIIINLTVTMAGTAALVKLGQIAIAGVAGLGAAAGASLAGFPALAAPIGAATATATTTALFMTQAALLMWKLSGNLMIVSFFADVVCRTSPAAWLVLRDPKRAIEIVAEAYYMYFSELARERQAKKRAVAARGAAQFQEALREGAGRRLEELAASAPSRSRVGRPDYRAAGSVASEARGYAGSKRLRGDDELGGGSKKRRGSKRHGSKRRSGRSTRRR
jgi:hypothetical protein